MIALLIIINAFLVLHLSVSPFKDMPRTGWQRLCQGVAKTRPAMWQQVGVDVGAVQEQQRAKRGAVAEGTQPDPDADAKGQELPLRSSSEEDAEQQKSEDEWQRTAWASRLSLNSLETLSLAATLFTLYMATLIYVIKGST